MIKSKKNIMNKSYPNKILKNIVGAIKSKS